MDLKHNTDISGVYYKYDLPAVNVPAEFKSQLIVAEDIPATAVENLLEKLEVDMETAYESFVIKLNQEYNNEVDMYGNVQKAGECQLKVLEFGIPIPFEYLENEEEMTMLRKEARYNPDMPGAMELVHPNKFLPSKHFAVNLHLDLRPIEEFRHTPLIPISEKELADYKAEVEARNRKGYFVEIKKDTLYYYSKDRCFTNDYLGIALLAFGFIFYVFMVTNEKTMKAKYDVERTRMVKHRQSIGSIGMGELDYRTKTNINKSLL